jgi:hypothetical protein
MLDDFDLDLTDIAEEDVERGTNVPAGYNYVRVKDTYEDHKNTDARVFEWEVLFDGPYRKSLIYDRLFDPSSASDPDKALAMRKRIAIYAKRLGLLSSDAFGKRVPINWTVAIGRECVLKTKERSYTDPETGEKKITIGVEFAGIYAIDDERVPEEVRKRIAHIRSGSNGSVAKPDAGSPTSGASQSKPTDPFSDL